MRGVRVEFDPAGRMGNRMFQLAFGYILSQRMKCELFHDGMPNFGIEPNPGNVKFPFIKTSQFGKQYADIIYIANTSESAIVNTFVQKSKYYLPYREELKKFFNIPNKEIINRNKLAVHIRETDYVDINCFLGSENYKRIIDHSGFNYEDIIIVTDNSYSPTVQRLVDLGCKLNTEGYVDKFTVISDNRSMNDFFTLLYSENIAISQSSFSWWAAFLGDHNKIIFPFTLKGKMWPLDPDVDDIDLYFNLGNSCKFIFD